MKVLPCYSKFILKNELDYSLKIQWLIPTTRPSLFQSRNIGIIGRSRVLTVNGCITIIFLANLKIGRFGRRTGGATDAVILFTGKNG